VTYHRPAAALRGAIASYYFVRVSGPGEVTDQIFPEWANFRLILSGRWTATFPGADPAPVPPSGVTGALERAVWVTGTEGLLAGVGLMPQGWPMFTDQSADEFADRMRPLADILGPAAEAMAEALRAARGEAAMVAVLDRTLVPRLRETPEAALVAKAHAELQDPAVQKVAAWAARAGLSPRQFERFCLRHFGLSPKRLLRRQRVLRTLAAMREAPAGGWSTSLDQQFTDQAHFIREFRYYMGQTPRAYLAREQPFMAEAWRRRQAVLGSPVQVLHPPAGEND
jgi:AraC-like DNA-binding protein